ncbi:MAG: hypothetical protein ABI479_08115 [Gallionella sp.]
MDTKNQLRHQIIKSLPLPHTENISDAAVLLWEQMATQIISIVGEGGFNSLYARSVVFARSAFPWLEFGSLSPQSDNRFAELKMCLERQPPAQVREANVLMLIAFTDILAALIGEHLTTSILLLSWGRDAADRVNKEST